MAKRKVLKPIDKKVIKIMNKIMNLAEELNMMIDEVDEKSDIIMAYTINAIYDPINEVHTYLMQEYGFLKK